MSKTRTFEDGILAGIAYTLAELCRMGHGQDTEIRNILDGAGLTIADLRAAGATDEDLSSLKDELGDKVWRKMAAMPRRASTK